MLLLGKSDYNILLVNWGDGAGGWYGKAITNTRVIGLEVAHFVNVLQREWGLDPADVHCIGHSLGTILHYAYDF